MADTPNTPPANLQDSKKGQGLLYGIIAILLAGAGAVATGPAGLAVLPYVLGAITGVVVAHQGAQGAQDIFNAKNANKPCDPPAPK